MNKHIWKDKNTLRPEVEESLLSIANDFIDKHNLYDAVVDITLTGSLAGENWHDKSDVDLHIIVDFDEFDESDELLRDYFKSIKTVWNDDHDINVCEFPIEIYVQSDTDEHHSNRVFSIMNQKWIVKRNVDKPKFDEDRVDNGFRYYKELISKIDNYDEAAKIKEEIWDMRSKSLKSHGEGSIGNQVFKKLRNNNILDKLIDKINDLYDQEQNVPCEAFSNKLDAVFYS